MSEPNHSTTHRVVVAQTAQAFEVRADESVLDAATRQGVRLPHECTFGGCGTCRVHLVQGSVRYEEPPLALSEPEAARGYALACQARPTSDLVISLETAAASVAEPSRRGAVVREAKPFTADIMHLALEIEDGQPLVYLPGQHMNVHLGDGAHRSFSMASTPRETALDFHIRRIPGGRFTTDRLAQLRAGDRLDVELPLGGFRYHTEDYRPLLMVATGTGIAPIKCILESLLDDPECPPVWLYWGMRREDDLYLEQTFRSWKGRLYEFSYVPVLSQANGSWQGRRGHVQQVVLDDHDDLSEMSIYLCGAPAMVADAKRAFATRGAILDHIYADGFSFQRHE